MRNLVLLASLLFLQPHISASGQDWSVGIGYGYLYSPQFDAAIQTYNMSRPFLEEHQPLLVNATFLKLGYDFESKIKFNSGLATVMQLARQTMRAMI